MHLAMAKIAIDLNLLEALVSHGRSMSVQELAQAMEAQDVLFGRILRYLAAFVLIAATSVDHFEATPIAQALTLPWPAAGTKHQFSASHSIPAIHN
ncbi:hypothetical protein APSETT445_004010 [Aspergillus pseudonomiae]